MVYEGNFPFQCIFLVYILTYRLLYIERKEKSLLLYIGGTLFASVGEIIEVLSWVLILFITGQKSYYTV